MVIEYLLLEPNILKNCLNNEHGHIIYIYKTHLSAHLHISYMQLYLGGQEMWIITLRQSHS